MASIIKSDNGVSSGITGIVQSADSSGQLVLQTTTSGGTATTAVTIDNTQKVTFANSIGFGSNAGITFNNSSALTNSTLNDYETGTWTPALVGDAGGSGQTYASRNGRYTKIGNIVFVEFDVTLSSLGSVSGTGCISGLPFAALSTSDISQGGGSITYMASLGVSVTSIVPGPQPGQSYLYPRYLTGAGTGYTVPAAASTLWTSSTRLVGMCWYQATF